jgi:nicotinamidase-related amidase
MGRLIPRTLEQACDPERLALLVYDMQVGVAGQIVDGPEVTARVGEVLEAARAAGVRVVFTRHVSLPMRLTGTGGLRTAMDWQRTDEVAELVEAFPPSADGTQLMAELPPRSDELVLDKLAMSAFVGTPLDFVLRDAGIDAFVIVGIALEVGIEPTVRHALDLGYLPVVVTDACGVGHAEAAERSLAQLAWFGGSVQTDTNTLISTLTRSGSPCA